MVFGCKHSLLVCIRIYAFVFLFPLGQEESFSVEPRRAWQHLKDLKSTGDPGLICFGTGMEAVQRFDSIFFHFFFDFLKNYKRIYEEGFQIQICYELLIWFIPETMPVLSYKLQTNFVSDCLTCHIIESIANQVPFLISSYYSSHATYQIIS